MRACAQRRMRRHRCSVLTVLRHCVHGRAAAGWSRSAMQTKVGLQSRAATGRKGLRSPCAPRTGRAPSKVQSSPSPSWAPPRRSFSGTPSRSPSRHVASQLLLPEPPLEGEDFRHGRQESAEEKKVPVPGRLTSHQALDIRAFLRGPLPAVAVPPRSAGCPVPVVVESWPPGPCVGRTSSGL